jgi:hypothetical protein
MSKEASTVELDYSTPEKSFQQLSIEEQQQLAVEEEEPRVTLKTSVVVSVSQSQCPVARSSTKAFQILSLGYGISFIPVPAMAAVGPLIQRN